MCTIRLPSSGSCFMLHLAAQRCVRETTCSMQPGLPGHGSPAAGAAASAHFREPDKDGKALVCWPQGTAEELGKRSKNSKGEECVELEEASLPNLAVEVRRKVPSKRRVKLSCMALFAMYGVECAPADVKTWTQTLGTSFATRFGSLNGPTSRL